MMMEAAKVVRGSRSFEKAVAYHLHNAILHDLDELMHDTLSLASSDASGRSSVSSSYSLDYSCARESKVCEVQFKHLHRHYVLPVSLNHVQVGEFVIVQSFVAKFEEDLGVITKIYDKEEFEAIQLMEGPRGDADETKVGRILRIASIAERLVLPMKFQREGPLLDACLSFVRSTSIPMTVYGVEYQHDGKVLFVYYVSDQRVDFRPLVKLLCKFLMKKVRVQMRKTNQCRQFIPVPSAREALVTGKHHLPI